MISTAITTITPIAAAIGLPQLRWRVSSALSLNDLNALSDLAHGFAAAARAVTRRFCPRLHNRVLRRLIGAWRRVITSPQPDGPYLLVGRRLFSLLCVRRCHLVGSSSPVAALRDMELGLL